MRFDTLGLPYWNSSRIDTGSHAANDSPNDEVRERERRGLQYGPNGDQRAACEDGFSTTEAITKSSDEESTNEASEIVAGDCDA